jgi:non-canonical poly(A) RNA polymerase PAPD5/7
MKNQNQNQNNHKTVRMGDESKNPENETDDFDDDFLVLEDNSDAESDEEDSPGEQASASEPSHDSTSDLPPWMAQHIDYRSVNYLVALHNEIGSFCKLMEPRDEEMNERNGIVEKFKTLAESIFDDCQVDVFGSQATGLCLPTSDIDIAIQLNETDFKDQKGESKKSDKEEMKNWNVPSGSPLQRLAAALREHWLSELSYLEVIENTRVPLVKFKHGPTDIAVDVCFNQTTGVHAAKLMHQYMDALPPLRPLTFVLKYFMAARGLNQPYTGGVGSFLLQMMIVSFLQHRERDCVDNRRPRLYNLGALLIEFFELYCTDFNFVTTGISIRFDGFYFPKGATDRKETFWLPQRPFSLAMENPFELTSDVGVSSFRISVVQRSFEVAFKTLLSHVTEPINPSLSILGAILPPTDEMRKRSTSLSRKSLQAARGNPKRSGGKMREPARKRQRR